MDHVRELPPAGAVRLWLVDTDRVVPLDTLGQDERAHAAAFTSGRHRIRYAAAHVALRGVLGAWLHRSPSSLRFVREPCPLCGAAHGRPALADSPGVHFSLSHSGGLALVAVAPMPVGVDVEEVPTAEAAGELALLLHPRERAELAARTDPSQRRLGVARAWVRKEAYLKGVGTGLSRATDLDYVGTVPDSPGAPHGWTLRDVAVPTGYAAATALATADTRGAGTVPRPAPAGGSPRLRPV